MERIAADRKDRFGNSVSFSYGIASERDGADIEAIVKQADARMYAAKRDYYMRAGNDRREG